MFFNTCPRRAILISFSSLIILLSSFGLHLSSLLVKCVKDVDCKSTYNNLYKHERFNLDIFNVILCCYYQKSMQKEPQSFSHCGSFDHPDLQSLTTTYVSFSFCNCNCVNISGRVIYHWKGRHFQWYITSPQIPNISVARPKNQICT